MLGKISSGFAVEKSEWLDFCVFKNEKLTFGAAFANLRTRVKRDKAWLPNENANTATCL